MSQLSERKAAWEAKPVAKTLARAPERPPHFETSSGIPVERFYTPDAAAEACPQVAEEYLEKLGFPGEYPFTRGVQPTMYRGRFWTMRQYAGLRHRGREQPALQLSAGAGADRPVRGVRPAHADRLRRRRPDLPGRGGQGGRVDLVAGRHGDAARRHPAGQGQHQHDHQRAGRDPAGDVHRGGAASRASSRSSCAARSRTTSSRNTSRAAPTSSRPRRRCG